MDQEKRNPILSIDVRVRFRGAIYRIDLARILKWAGALLVLGIRLYRTIHGAPS